MINTKLKNIFFEVGFQKYFFNTGWMFLEKILRLFAGLFVGVAVARYLGPANFGVLNYILSVVGILSAFSVLGLDQVLIKEFIKGDINKEQLLGTSVLLRIIGTCIAFIIVTIFIQVTNSDHETAFLFYLIMFGLFFDSFTIIDWFFQSQVKAKFIVRYQISTLIVMSILRITLIVMKASLYWFAFSYTLEYFILSICLLYLYFSEVGNLAWKFSQANVLVLLKNSWPLLFSTLAINLFMKIDQVMIKWMLGNEASGVYAVVVRLSEMWNFIPLAICASVFPAIINSRLINKALFQKRLRMLMDFMVVLSISIAIPTTFLSGFVIEMLYGQAYKEAASILIIYIWSTVFVFIGVANGKWIISENLNLYQMINTGIALVINVVLNIFLINLMGLQGAAYSTLISYSVSAYFGLVLFKKTRHIFTYSSQSLNVLSLGRRIFHQLQ